MLKASFKYIFLFLNLVFFAVLLPASCNAQTNASSNITSLKDSLKQHMNLGIQFLHRTQRREESTKSILYYKGEWPTTMGLRISFFLLGNKKPVDDSNCFSVSSVHNALAKIYLNYPEYKEIPEMLDLAFSNILTYENGGKFNFWHLQQPYRKLKRNDVPGSQPLIRRPTNFRLRTRYINNAANVVEDADDTALAYTSMNLRRQIGSNFPNVLADLDTQRVNNMHSVATIFNPYLDTNRHNRHWYNYINGNDHNTGAFLTWLGDEYQFKHWNIIKVVGHNATFFLSFSECFPHAYVPYIPYGSNDLDGVVNANIIATLALYDELNAKGTGGAYRFLESKSQKRRYDRVGIYYPNRYQFPYAVSKAYSNGAVQVGKAMRNITGNLLEKQQKDGSWKSRRIVNKKDRIQSTAYAINTLINYGDYETNNTKTSIERGIRYLMNHCLVDGDGIHWEGGVFFSGGTVIRNTLFWKSDAYTTAIISNAFANYHQYLVKEEQLSKTEGDQPMKTN